MFPIWHSVPLFPFPLVRCHAQIPSARFSQFPFFEGPLCLHSSVPSSFLPRVCPLLSRGLLSAARFPASRLYFHLRWSLVRGRSPSLDSECLVPLHLLPASQGMPPVLSRPRVARPPAARGSDRESGPCCYAAVDKEIRERDREGQPNRNDQAGDRYDYYSQAE